jgi:Glycosyl transferase family 90
LDYKFHLIIDGNGVASNGTWVFGAGSVPILVGRWAPIWLRSAQPWVQYAPVDQSLDDLDHVISHLLTNPSLAENIANRARALAAEVLSPKGQYDITFRNFTEAMKRRQEYGSSNVRAAPMGWPGQLTEKLGSSCDDGGLGK